MSNIITTTGRSVGTITAEIVAISNQAAKNAYFAMVEIGKRLVEVKEQLPHGEWGDYLKNEVNFSQSTANNFMRIYERANEGNSQTFANLGYSHIVKLLALPDEELEEFAETHDVQSMSVRELNQAIKERDEERRLRTAAEKEMEAAQAAARDAEQRLLDLQQLSAAAQSSSDARQEEMDKLQAALNKATAAAERAKKQVKDLKENPRLSPEQRERLIAEAKAEATEAARAEVQEQLDTANQTAQDLRAQLDAAQAQVQAAAADKKAEKMSDPDVIRFNDLGKQILDDLNRLDGYRLKIVTKDASLDPKLRAYLAKLAAIVNKRYGVAPVPPNTPEVKPNEQG